MSRLSGQDENLVPGSGRVILSPEDLCVDPVALTLLMLKSAICIPPVSQDSLRALRSSTGLFHLWHEDSLVCLLIENSPIERLNRASD